MPIGQPIRFTVPALEPGLRARRVVQTIRSKTEVFKNKWATGQTVPILFKDERIGQAEITLIQPVPIAELTQEDARLGGFPRFADLRLVLQRFFRSARDIGPIEVYRVRFTWKS